MKTERLASETGDVDGGVAVATMGRSAFAAGPSPDIQIFYSLRPAARVAARAGLGGVDLVHFCKHPPCVIAFISEEFLQHRPTHVERGLAVARGDLPCGRDIPDEHRAGVVDAGAGILVQRLLAPVLDLRVDGLHQQLLVASLSVGELRLEIAVEIGLLEIPAVARRSDGLEAEVDADDLGAVGGLRRFDLADQVAVPAPPRILAEIAGFDPAGELAVHPEAERLAAQLHPTTFERHVLVGERDPAQRALRASADAPAQLRLPGRLAALDELEHDVLHDLRWQSDFLAGSFGQVNQLFFADPRPDALRRPLADVVAVIPDEIDLGTQPDQLLPARRLLAAKAEGLVELGFVGHRPHGFMVEHTRNAFKSAHENLVNIVPKEAKRLPLDRAALYPRPEGRGFTAEEDNVVIDEIHNQRSAVRGAELSRLGKSSSVNGAAIKRRPKLVHEI